MRKWNMASLTPIIFLFLITNNSLLISQTQFRLAIGGTNGEAAYSIIQTTDGGYALAGLTASFGAGGGDFYIVKLDATGTLQWSKSIGGTNDDVAYSIVQTTDGGYALGGVTYSFGAGSGDFYIVKLDSNGTLLWSRTIGGTGDDYGKSIIQTTDGGYAVAGYTTSFGAGGGDFYIVKLDGIGTLQWSRTVGGTDGEAAYSIIQTTDGGYALAGLTTSFGAGLVDFYIVKLDGSGTLQWSRTVGGINYDYAYSIIQTTDGGYAVAGQTDSFGAGSSDMYIVKLDASGMFLWSRTVGGTNYDYAESIILTTDGGYAVAGSTRSFGAGNSDMYIVKLDGSGTLQWSRTVGGTYDIFASSIIQTTDSGYAVAGSTGVGNYHMYVVKLDASGNTCGNTSLPSSTSGTGGVIGSPTSTVTSPTSTVTSPTSLTGTGGTVTPICITGIQPISNEIPSSYELHQNYPNPFNPTTKIRFALPKSSVAKLVIYDILGREVETIVNEQLKLGNYEVEWNPLNYPSGVYYYRLNAGDFQETKKMVLLK